jgi:hypothetical protein
MAFQNYYYSGQGILWIAERDSAGRPKNQRRVGNIPELTLNIETTKFEHKESESGNRLKDLVIIQEKNGTFQFTLENIDRDNLALGLWGDKVTVAGGSATNEAAIAVLDQQNSMKHPGISAVTVTVATIATWVLNTVYALGAFVKPTAGTHYFVATTGGTSAGTEPTWNITGGSVADGTVVWQDAGVLPVTLVLNTDYTINAVVGSLSWIGIQIGAWGLPVEIDYTWAAYVRVDAFTQSVAPERYLRFEGINTVDGKNVIVEIFKAQFDPLTGYGLINEELAQLTMQGSLLADTLQVGGSQYFKQINLA